MRGNDGTGIDHEIARKYEVVLLSADICEFALVFGNYSVKLTVPSDHIVGATGTIQNPKQVLSKEQVERLERAKTTYDKPVFIVSVITRLWRNET